MTSKLKCPFCQRDLRTVLDSPFYTCDSCGYTGYKQLWRALIQAKQDLAKAIDVIDTVRQHKRGTAVICPNDIAAYCDSAGRNVV